MHAVRHVHYEYHLTPDLCVLSAGEFQVQLQPPATRQAVPSHAAAAGAAVLDAAAASPFAAAAPASASAAAALKTPQAACASSDAAATSAAATAGDHSPDAAAAAAAAFCLNASSPFPAALLHQQGPSKQTNNMLAVATSNPVCNAAAPASADVMHASHTAVYNLGLEASLQTADSLSPNPKLSALAQLPAAAAEAYAAASSPAISCNQICTWFCSCYSLAGLKSRPMGRAVSHPRLVLSFTCWLKLPV